MEKFDKNINFCYVKTYFYFSGSSQDRSGAYLFMPDGPATDMFGQSASSPFRIIRGPLVNEVHILNALVLQRLSLYRFWISKYFLEFDHSLNPILKDFNM